MIKRKGMILFSDIKYMWLNGFVRHIPAWRVRRFFYRLAGMKIGKDSRIGIGTIIVRAKGITLGCGCIINEYCHLDGRGKLTIGDNTSISIYTKIISASHELNEENFAYKSGSIVIMDHVFIGVNAIILENTFIDTGAVIGAGAIAKGNFEKNIIYAGNPIRKVKERNCSNTYNLFHEAYFR